MARARVIKPGFFLNEDLAELPMAARLLFAGLWTLADRAGRLEDRPRKIKAELLPYDDCDVDALLDQLAGRGFIIRYEAGGRFIQVTNFSKHQSPHIKEAASTIPAPEQSEGAPDKHRASTVQAPDKHQTSTPSLLVTRPLPESLNPEVVLVSNVSDAAASDAPAPEPAPVAVAAEPETERPPRTRPAPKPPRDTTGPAAFQAFYAAYPKHEAKADALAAWNRLKPDSDLVAAIMAGVACWQASGRWEDPKYIPLPATFLNGRRWEDEPMPAAAARASPNGNGHKGQPATYLRDIGSRFVSMVQEVEHGRDGIRDTDAQALPVALPRQTAR